MDKINVFLNNFDEFLSIITDGINNNDYGIMMAVFETYGVQSFAGGASFHIYDFMQWVEAIMDNAWFNTCSVKLKIIAGNVLNSFNDSVVYFQTNSVFYSSVSIFASREAKWINYYYYYTFRYSQFRKLIIFLQVYQNLEDTFLMAYNQNTIAYHYICDTTTATRVAPLSSVTDFNIYQSQNEYVIKHQTIESVIKFEYYLLQNISNTTFKFIMKLYIYMYTHKLKDN